MKNGLICPQNAQPSLHKTRFIGLTSPRFTNGLIRLILLWKRLIIWLQCRSWYKNGITCLISYTNTSNWPDSSLAQLKKKRQLQRSSRLNPPKTRLILYQTKINTIKRPIMSNTKKITIISIPKPHVTSSTPWSHGLNRHYLLIIIWLNPPSTIIQFHSTAK